MKDEKKVEFTQKWIGDAVKKLLEKEVFMKVIWRKLSTSVSAATSLTPT